MEDKLKARLTGAAILVALLVLVVPELFRGAANPPPAAPSATTPTPDNAAPLNSYQIDLQPGASAGTASAADNDVATVNAPEGSAGDAAPGSAPAPAPGAGAAPASAPKAAGTHANATTPAAAATQKPPPSAASPPKTPLVKTPAAKSAAAATTTTATTPATSHGWTVRLGVFSKRDNAQRLRQQLQAKGVAVTVAGPDGRGLYSVAGPRLAERAAAADWLKHVKGLGFTGVLTEAP